MSNVTLPLPGSLAFGPNALGDKVYQAPCPQHVVVERHTLLALAKGAGVGQLFASYQRWHDGRSGNPLITSG